MRFNCACACEVQQRSRLPTRFSRPPPLHRPDRQRDALSTLSSVAGNLDAGSRAWEEQQDCPEPTAGTPPDHPSVRPSAHFLLFVSLPLFALYGRHITRNLACHSPAT
ncbi:hypothetical protein OH76DRAFT_1211581 [Lentinus brumalis]|uniref:Uncharacterized protein n=1 Tax=Lentinus brumalis TaxID=2498619 RepID=A0A371DLB7_9APHY|nr:hypothetical protein OH76DRAFT_1211581 [Polyporus brumalis]